MDCERNLFDRFGGVRPMADAMLEPPSTVQSWKTAGRIPATKQPDVLSKADELGLDVHAIDVIFPLRRRPDACAPVNPLLSGHADGSAIEAGAPIVAFDQRAEMKRAAGA